MAKQIELESSDERIIVSMSINPQVWEAVHIFAEEVTKGNRSLMAEELLIFAIEVIGERMKAIAE